MHRIQLKVKTIFIPNIFGHLYFCENATMIRTSATRSRRGSSQCTLHSQWLSRNVNTGALATSAPRTRERIKPSNTDTA